MTSWVDEGRALDVVFRKAFDTLSHKMLPCKISYGLDEGTVGWIKSWTNDRAQGAAVRGAV